MGSDPNSHSDSMSKILEKPGSDPVHSRLNVAPVEAALGAEVRDLDLKRLDDATFKALHDAFLLHLILVVRGQSLKPEDIVVLAKRFGVPVSSSNLHQR